MGLRNEYSYDAFTGEDVIEDVEEEDEMMPLDEESWEDWHSEHILNMWMSIREYLETNGLNNTMLQRASYHDFIQFIHDFSS